MPKLDFQPAATPATEWMSPEAQRSLQLVAAEMGSVVA
jgi:hypothetical protein